MVAFIAMVAVHLLSVASRAHVKSILVAVVGQLGGVSDRAHGMDFKWRVRGIELQDRGILRRLPIISGSEGLLLR